jgi:EmrB/QacA subfamily drug resistance transporter
MDGKGPINLSGRRAGRSPATPVPGSSWAALAVLSAGLFLTLLDVTIVNLGIPSLTGGLHASLDQVLWVLNAYTVAFAVLLITAGRLGDLYGPRALFVAGLAVFTAASALCGLARSPGELIAARAVQGVGGALLTPQPLAIVLGLFPAERRGAAFAVNGVVAGVASLSGPTVGGLIVTHLGWRWMFFVNVPVGVVALTLTFALVPALRPRRRPQLDLTGVLLATGALTAITFGLVEGQRYDWGVVWGPVTIPEIIGAGLLLALVFLEVQLSRREKGLEALVPFRLFRDPNFSLMNLVGAGLQFCLVGLFLPLSIYLQGVLGLSALQAGLVLVPSSLASMAVAPVVGRLADRFGGKWILVAGLAVFGAGIAMLDWSARVDADRWSLVAALVVAGAGSGAVFVPMLHVAMRQVPAHVAGAAAGALSTTRQLGSVLGGAAVGALLQDRLARAVPHQADLFTCLLPTDDRNLIVAGYRAAARGGALLLGGGRAAAGGGSPFPLPEDVRLQLAQLGHDVFTHAYVDAMRPTLLAPIAVLALAAAACLAIRRGPVEVEP